VALGHDPGLGRRGPGLVGLESVGEGVAAKGQYELALKRFDETLTGMELKDDRWKSLNYSKGLTLAQSGKEKEALDAFLAIYEVDVAFKDVSKRIEDLQQKVKA